MSSLFQSDYFITVVFTSILGLIGLATYLFGFKKSEPEKIEEESAPKRTRTKQKELKTKKKTEPELNQVSTPPQTPEPPKAQKKASESPKKVAKKQTKKEAKKEVVVEENNVKVEETGDNSEWTTVIDKRAQKKQKIVPHSNYNEESTKEKSKVEDLSNKQLIIGFKQPSELLTESVIQQTETKEKEDDWMAASQKIKKDKKKDKKESQPVPEVVPQVVPIVPEVKPVEKTKSKKAKQTQNLTSAIHEAIVDTIEAKNTKQTLKQTSLTDSIILIEKENKRTESNQSSNESLQDVDGDDGFITITNKKSKRTVRREQ